MWILNRFSTLFPQNGKNDETVKLWYAIFELFRLTTFGVESTHIQATSEGHWIVTEFTNVKVKVVSQSTLTTFFFMCTVYNNSDDSLTTDLNGENGCSEARSINSVFLKISIYLHDHRPIKSSDDILWRLDSLIPPTSGD